MPLVFSYHVFRRAPCIDSYMPQGHHKLSKRRINCQRDETVVYDRQLILGIVHLKAITTPGNDHIRRFQIQLLYYTAWREI